MSANIDTPTPEGQALADTVINRARADDALVLHRYLRAFTKCVFDFENLGRGERPSGSVAKAMQRFLNIFPVNDTPEDANLTIMDYFKWLFNFISPPRIDLDQTLDERTKGQYGYFFPISTSTGEKKPPLFNAPQSMEFLGDGYIRLNDDIFNDATEIVRILAHELWHDYQGEHIKYDNGYEANLTTPYAIDTFESMKNAGSPQEIAAKIKSESFNKYKQEAKEDIPGYTDTGSGSVRIGNQIMGFDQAATVLAEQAILDEAHKEYAKQKHERDARYFANRFIDEVFAPALAQLRAYESNEREC